jgi:hypothetical protein
MMQGVKSLPDCIQHSTIAVPWLTEKGQKKEEGKRRSGYYHYSPVPSGGLRGANGGILNDRDSEAWWVRV